MEQTPAQRVETQEQEGRDARGFTPTPEELIKRANLLNPSSSGSAGWAAGAVSIVALVVVSSALVPLLPPFRGPWTMSVPASNG
jgi:hypothetical protein